MLYTMPLRRGTDCSTGHAVRTSIGQLLARQPHFSQDPQFLSLSILTAALVLHNIPRSASPFLGTLLFLLSWLP